VVGIRDAGSEENDTNTEKPLLVLVSCPVDNRPDNAPRLWGKLKIRVSPGSRAYSIYKKTEIEESFNCNYELNPEYREIIESGGLKVSGVTPEGGSRIVEIPGKRFFLATGFLPQAISEPGRPHPLITAFLKTASGYQEI
jgi:CTP synthase (UTP-ammonia lyase)